MVARCSHVHGWCSWSAGTLLLSRGVYLVAMLWLLFQNRAALMDLPWLFL